MNAHALQGHNNPPTEFDERKQAIDDLLLEASNWLDGQEVSSQGEADAIAKILDLSRKERKKADDCRKAEAKPFDDGKKAVQAKYKPLLDRCDLVSSSCKKANLPWLKKLEEEQRKAEQEKILLAEKAAQKAQEAMAASRYNDLEARQKAEELSQAAKAAEKEAAQAARQKSQAKGGARAMALRTIYRHEITDMTAFARWCWANEKEALEACLNDIARTRVANKWRDMPGVAIHEEKVAV